MKDVLEGQQTEIAVPSLISNDGTESLWRRYYDDYRKNIRIAAGRRVICYWSGKNQGKIMSIYCIM